MKTRDSITPEYLGVLRSVLYIALKSVPSITPEHIKAKTMIYKYKEAYNQIGIH
jgi:hypothetical protein